MGLWKSNENSLGKISEGTFSTILKQKFFNVIIVMVYGSYIEENNILTI